MALDKDHKCDICVKKFSTRKSMLSHKRCHTETFKCEICDIQYERERSLKRHLDTIHNENPKYVCPHCKKKKGGKSELKKHIRTHDVDNFYKFACPYCQKRCKSEDSVQHHMKYSHTKVKDQECNHCDQKFAYKSNLLSHQSVHATKLVEEFLDCHLCGQKLKSVTTLKIHLRMHTGESLTNVKHLSRHLDSIHTLKDIT